MLEVVDCASCCARCLFSLPDLLGNWVGIGLDVNVLLACVGGLVVVVLLAQVGVFLLPWSVCLVHLYCRLSVFVSSTLLPGCTVAVLGVLVGAVVRFFAVL